MTFAKLALTSAAIIGSLIVAVPEVSAMPVVSNVDAAASSTPSTRADVQDVLFVRRPYGRFGYHRFGYRRFGYRPYYHRRVFPGRVIGRAIRRAL